MKIRVLRTLGHGLPDYHEGQVAEVNDKLGTDLCRRGLAEAVSGDPALKAVPEEPMKAVPEEGSVEKAEEDAKEYASKAKGKKR